MAAKKIFILLAIATSFLGCAPTHTLKEVLNDPGLLLPDNSTSGDNPLAAADQWVRTHLW